MSDETLSARQRGLCWFYVMVSVVALMATWSQNVAYFKGGRGAMAFLTFMVDTKANPASRSITVDIGFFLLAACAFMVVEARRLRIRFVWLYIAFAFVIAISVTFPLFMVAREIRTASTDATETSWSLTPSDLIGLTVVAAAVVGLSWFVLS